MAVTALFGALLAPLEALPPICDRRAVVLAAVSRETTVVTCLKA